MIRSIYSSLKGGISLWDPQESSHLYLCHFATLSCPQSVSYGTSQQAQYKNTPSTVGSVYSKLLRERFMFPNVNLRPRNHSASVPVALVCISSKIKCYKLKANSNAGNKTGLVSFLCLSWRYKEGLMVLFLLTCFIKRAVSVGLKKIRAVRLNQIPSLI